MTSAVDRGQETPRRWAATLMRGARTGALATLEKGSGTPYASLATVATDPGGAPVLLISRLALHTQNIAADPRVSLMCDAQSLAAGARGEDDPLALGRVTVIGRAERVGPQGVRERFLARHPGAAMYVDFPDFAFYRIAVERAHFIGGFGRIVDIPGKELTIAPEVGDALAGAEAGIVAHMNEDHADALQLYATVLLGEKPGRWRMTGIDPEGLDLMSDSGSARLWFEHPVTSPGDVRKELVRLAEAARAAGTGTG